ncbi:MAG: CHAT domain-containing protein [Gloeomargarita sp. SKYB31]|nr:CHAT domain-containing protein [Gloeomargarita sp. SKYB31]
MNKNALRKLLLTQAVIVLGWMVVGSPPAQAQFQYGPPTNPIPEPTPKPRPDLDPRFDILLRGKTWSPLPVDPFQTPLERMAAVDTEFKQRFGLTGLEPENNLSLAEIQNVLKQAEERGRGRTALIYWWLRDGNLTVAMVLPKGVAEQTTFLSTVSMNAREVQQTISQFINAIQDPRQRATTHYRVPGQKLYQWLIAPLEPILDKHQVQTLLLVPDEHFRGLPYRALWTGNEHLVERYRLSQIPSINLVNLDLTSKGIYGQTVVMGSEDFGGRQPQLPAARIEVNQIAEITRGQKHLNQDFTASNFLTAWQRHAGFAFHVATHAEFLPTRSYIEFYDQPLEFSALQRQLRANPSELVVLSACRTAIGDVNAELGFAGLAVRLGAKRVVASLWRVEDEPTLALMNDFYRRLRANGENLPHSEALRQAQIAMLRGDLRVQDGQLVAANYTVPLATTHRSSNPNFTHPYYWAAFNMIGNPW